MADDLNDAQWESFQEAWRGTAEDAGVEVNDFANMLLVLKARWNTLTVLDEHKRIALPNEIARLEDAQMETEASIPIIKAEIAAKKKELEDLPPRGRP